MSIFLILLFTLLALGAAEYHRRRKQREIDEMMIEGATLANVPELKTLIAHHEAREAIAANILEIVFNPNVFTDETRNREVQDAEAFVIDDGGGVHVIGRAKANTMFGDSIEELEGQAEVLAELLGLELVRV